MLVNNWFLIDGFRFNDFLRIENILKVFLDFDKKHILFSWYFFNLDDCDLSEDYSKDQCIDEEFEYFIKRADSSIDYDKISDEIKNRLFEEYCRLFKNCDVAMKEELYKSFIADNIDHFDEEFIYSIKEYIAREMTKPKIESLNFINERKVLENNKIVSFTENRPYVDEYRMKMKYTWYEPKSEGDLLNVLNNTSNSFSGIITEDINDFDKYLYAFELFEQNDLVLAINDRVGDFELVILPRIKELLDDRITILNEVEYFERLEEIYTLSNDEDITF
jgi:hypothetical protein